MPNRCSRSFLVSWFIVAVTGALSLQVQAQDLVVRPSAGSVGLYQKLTFTIGFGADTMLAATPDLDLVLEITCPSGRSLIAPAFLDQPYERHKLGSSGHERDWFYPVGTAAWRVRFAPSELGRHTARARLQNGERTLISRPVTFDCTPSTSRGFVRMSQSAPRFLEFDGHQPFFPIGQNLAFIGPAQYVTLAKAERILTQLASNGANYLRVWATCDDWAMAIEARKSAWGRSWDWHPPFVPAPGAADPKEQCVQWSADQPELKLDPSYQVALRPSTRYVLTGRVRTEASAKMRLRFPEAQADTLLASTESAWTTFHQEFETAPDAYWLGPLSFRVEGAGHAWLADLSLRESGVGPELLWEAEVNRPVRGFYNPTDCFMLDELLAAAERSGVYVQLCLLTRDLYMNALKDPGSEEYTRAIADAKKLFRYAIARWGYSTSIASWEYWNEMNPNLPTDRFYTALGGYLEQADLYHHLRSTSTWGPSAKDCRHPKLDVADVHFYLRPSDQGHLSNEVDAVLERTHWLREQAPSKPVHLGEFGLADEKWRITPEMQKSNDLTDVHNALWASALSGSTGTVLPWWWERIDQHDGYSIYGPLSRFVAEIPWTSGSVQKLQAKASQPQIRVIGLKSKNSAWLWLFDPQSAWSKVVIEKRTPPQVEPMELELAGVGQGTYTCRWWDTRQGTVLRDETVSATRDDLVIRTPEFRGDIACQVLPR